MSETLNDEFDEMRKLAYMYPGVRFDTSGVVMSDYANEFHKDGAFEELQSIEFLKQHRFELIIHCAAVHNFIQSPLPPCWAVRESGRCGPVKLTGRLREGLHLPTCSPAVWCCRADISRAPGGARLCVWVCRERQPSTVRRQSPSQAWQLFQLVGTCWRWNWLILNKGRQKSPAFASQTFLLQGLSVAGSRDLLGRWRYLHSWGFTPQCQEP